MKKDWKYKKLGEVAEISAGQGAPQGENNYSDIGTPFIKAGNLEDLINGLSEMDVQKVSEDVAKSHRLKKYKAGSVLFAKSGMSCMKGWVYTLKTDCYVVSHLAIITPFDIESSFLNYYLKFNKPNNLVQDAAYPSISLKDIQNLRIPTPEMQEQQQIVAELDLLSTMIEKQKAQIEELNKLTQSIFYDMFGDPVTNEKDWEIKSLEDIFVVTSSKRIYQEEQSNTGIPFLRVADVVSMIEGKELIPALYITYDKYSELVANNQVPKVGDLLVTSRGTLGKIYIMNENDRFYFQDGMITWLINKAQLIIPIFAKAMLECEGVQAEMKKSSNTSTVAFISISKISKIKIPLPPIALQQEFAAKVEAIEAMKAKVRQSLKEAETLFNSRMDYYFN